MKFSYLNRRRRRGLIPELEKAKQDEMSGSSGIWESIVQSHLTKLQADDKMKKEKEIIELNQEGEFRKFSESKIKRKLTQKKLDLQSLNVGYYILIPMIGGVFIGFIIDNQFKTKPLFIGIFLFFGIVAAFYNLLKLLKE